ncbi:carbohydrate ABC transporter permease [Streptacidiphilus sp. N1-3]|uniref:Carbohydrate ABC transporter permease n=1 Tax=Streptacidiphilus alkalitolerans TaxID=3342712 RepID=A0ABV6X9G4_9ACTN
MTPASPAPTPPARTAPAPASPALRAKRRRHRLRVMLFLSPWLVGFAVFLLYPLGTTVYLSFTNSNMISPAQWVGLRNYRFMFGEDPFVWQSIRNTGWLVVIMVPAQVLFALGVAMLTARLKSGAGVFRTLFYLPALAPPVAATVAFVCMFNPATGPVNQVLRLLGIDGPLWFNADAWSKPALTLLALWGSGSAMVIFLAALLDVPAELYEAAALDGANPWQRFRWVTLPTISPVLMFSMVTGVIAALQYFTQAMVAAQTAGGTRNEVSFGYPGGSSLTFSQWIYATGFTQFHMGYACALAVVLFAVSMLFTVLLLRRASGFTPQEAAA